MLVVEADRWTTEGRRITDSDVLERPVEILGRPILEVELASAQPQATLIVRLCDVHPDGASTRVSYGVLNLAHRDSSESPEALEPGRPYNIRVQLNAMAYRFPAGHRLRMALSTTYWPITWPSARASELTLRCRSSSLTLPIRPPREEDGEGFSFDERVHVSRSADFAVLRLKLSKLFQKGIRTVADRSHEVRNLSEHRWV